MREDFGQKKEEILITDEEIAITLQALRESSLEIPEDLHSQQDPVSDLAKLGNDLGNHSGNGLGNDLGRIPGNGLGNGSGNDFENGLGNGSGSDFENGLGNGSGSDFENGLGNGSGNDFENGLGNGSGSDFENGLGNNPGNDLGNNPGNNHREISEQDLHAALEEALREQERLRMQIRMYQDKESEEEIQRDLMDFALQNAKAQGIDLGDACDGEAQGEHAPTMVRVSSTGQLLDENGNVVVVDRRSRQRTVPENISGKRKFSDTFHYQLYTRLIVPMLVLMLLLLIVAGFVQYGRIENENKVQLQACAVTMQEMMNRMYGRDASLYEKNDFYAVVIGDHVLGEEDSEFLDGLKKETGIDYSYFYQNTRILTTIRDRLDNRLVNTTVSDQIYNEVINSREDVFYNNVTVDGNAYYALYKPLISVDGTVYGMLALAKPSGEVVSQIIANLWPVAVLLLVVMAVMFLLTLSYAKKVTGVLSAIELFSKRVAAGNLSAKLPEQVLGRKDEIGSMGKSITSMQSSLRELIEKDALTTLPNRRYADKQLKNIQTKAANTGSSFALAIADIDFFKKVNDTYGHECGDVVLKQTAMILKKGMSGKGFASRWGGEEFLLVFDHFDEEEAYKTLEWIRLEIEAQTIMYDEMLVHRTMSFGVTTGNAGLDADLMLKKADECLYFAKESGRNRVITSLFLSKELHKENT